MLLGAVLAGGQSRRFGSDKAVARWRGRLLTDHAIDTIRPYVDEMLICGRNWPGMTCAPDRPKAGLGPLGGLNAALRHAADEGFDRVLSVPCDVPAVPDALLRRLAAHAGSAFVGDLPVIGIWPATLAGQLDRLLASDSSRSVRRWAAVIDAARLELAPGEQLVNVNRPADLLAFDAGG